MGISVRGGVGGIEARYDDMVAAARSYGAAGAEAAALAGELAARQVDLGSALSAAADPVGAGQVEWAILDAITALGRLAVECAALDVELRTAAAAYLQVDRLDDRAAPLLHAVEDLPQAGVAAVAATIGTGSLIRGGNTFVTSDPDLVAGLVDELGGVGGRVMHVLGAAMPDGTARVRAVRVDADLAPPRSVRDLIAGLATRNDGAPGEIDVRILTGADGRRAVIVDIPGTKSWTPLPTTDVTSIATDLRAVHGADTTYQRGIEDAMRRAGVRADDDVMLVGHSEGGLVAVNLARDAWRSREFHVTHVVTAGAPLGDIAATVPAPVRVLAIENRGDVVPSLDAARNPDRVNVTTVTVDHDDGDLLDDHDLRDSYLPGAIDIDGSRDPSVRDVLDSAAPYFGASEGTTHVFQIRRGLN